MITLSVSKDITAGYTEMYVPFERLASITSKFNYSPSSYREGYRKQDNVINLGNTLMFDFDDGSISIDEMVGFLNDNGVTAFLSTTKSHNKDKHGKVCERYRVIVPLSDKINLPVNKFGDFYMFVASCLLCVAGFITFTLNEDRNYKKQREKWLKTEGDNDEER